MAQPDPSDDMPGHASGEVREEPHTGETTVARLDRLDALTDILLRHPAVDALMPALLEYIQVVMRVDNVAILRLQLHTQELIMDTVRGPEETVAHRVHIPVGKGIAGSIFTSRQPRIIPDLAAEDVVNSFLREQVRSLMGVPLLVEGRAIGVLHVSTLAPRIFTHEDLSFLQLIADRIALTLDRVGRLREAEHARMEAERAAFKLQTLQAINDVVMRHVGVPELASELLPVVHHVMRVDNVAILLPASDDGLRLFSVFGPEKAVMDIVHVPIGKGVAGKIMATGRPLIIADLSQSDAVNPFLREKLRSLLGVPLRIDARVLGVLHISTVAPREFTAEDLDLLQVVAARIAIALDRAQVFAAMRQAQQDAEAHARQIAEVNQRMDTFLSIASHELRTPLTSLIANTTILERRIARLLASGASAQDIGELTLRFTPRMYAQGQRLNGLVSDLLDVSRIQANQLEIRRERQDVRECVRAAVEEQRLQAPDRDIHLSLTEKPVLAQIDADRVGQVVTNFLTNALKFAPQEHAIQVSVTQSDSYAQVAVQDRGPGIPQSEQARIWDRFQRVDNIETVNGSKVGLGLGLYICKTIIDRHHGAIGVTSAIGEGSTFWFRIPLAGPVRDVEAPKTAARKPRHSN